MTIVQCFAQIAGAVYLLVGIKRSSRLHRYLRKPTQFGFLGGFLYTGFVLCSLAVNWLHNTTHAVIGIAELNVCWNPTAASAYALALGVADLELFILLGLFWSHPESSSPRGDRQTAPAPEAPVARWSGAPSAEISWFASPLVLGSTPVTVGSSVTLRPILFAIGRLYGTAQPPVEAAETVQMSSAGTRAPPTLALGMSYVTPLLPGMIYLGICVPIGPPPLVAAFKATDDAQFVYAALLTFGTWTVLRRIRFRHRLNRSLLLE